MSVPVDASKASRSVWLVRVPAAFASALNAVTPGTVVGDLFPSAGDAGGVGRKRGRAQMRLRLRAEMLQTTGASTYAGVRAGTGAHANVITASAAPLPASYTLDLDPPNGTRLLETPSWPAPGVSGAGGAAGSDFGTDSSVVAGSSSSGTRWAWFGETSQAGALKPNARDASFAASTAVRRAGQVAAAAGRRATSLAADGEAPTLVDLAQARADAESERVAAAAAAAAAAANAFASAQDADRLRPAANIYACFERDAYWLVRDLVTATGAREPDIKAELQQTCDYIRAGPHIGCWRLKPSFRSISAVPPDANDGVS